MMERPLMWSIISALLLYGIWQGYRAFVPLSRERRIEPHEADAQTDIAEEDEIGDEGFNYAPIPVREPTLKSSVTTGVAPDLFQTELELQQVLRENSDLRALLKAQQEKIAQLDDELTGLREQREQHFSEDGMAPQYGEALLLARRGLTAEVIAERCDISVAEAALVKSMTTREHKEERR